MSCLPFGMQLQIYIKMHNYVPVGFKTAIFLYKICKKIYFITIKCSYLMDFSYFCNEEK